MYLFLPPCLLSVLLLVGECCECPGGLDRETLEYLAMVKFDTNLNFNRVEVNVAFIGILPGWSKANPSVYAVYRISGLPDWRFTGLAVYRIGGLPDWACANPSNVGFGERSSPSFGGFGGRSLPRFGGFGERSPPRFGGFGGRSLQDSGGLGGEAPQDSAALGERSRQKRGPVRNRIDSGRISWRARIRCD